MKPQARKVRKKNSALKKKVRKKNSVFVRGTTAIKKGESQNTWLTMGTNLSMTELAGFGSKQKTIKRVSFADELVQTTSALKQPKLEAEKPLAMPKSVLMNEAGVENSEKKPVQDKENGEKASSEGIQKRISLRRGKKLMVTRNTKAKLLAMSGKDRRAFIKELRMRKPNFELSASCKMLWETLRSKEASTEERKKCAEKIYTLIKGKCKKLVFAHDTSRVIECLVNVGGSNIRNALVNELISEIIYMAKSKYARNIVLKMLKYGGAAQREALINAFCGHCVSLLSNSTSAPVLEAAYNDYAQALQRYNIIIEFYSKEFHSLKVQGRIRTLKEIIEEEPTRRTAVMSYMEQILKDLVERPQLKMSLTLRLLEDFLLHCNANQMSEMVDSLKTQLPEIVHTLDGTRVALKCLWNAPAKDRKIMIKNFKGLVVKTCQDTFAYRVIIGILDAVDDTVLVNKYILQELIKNIGDVCESEHGIRVIHYLIHPRNPRYFKKSVLALFSEGDENKSSKKEPKQRFKELFDSVKGQLCAYFAENMELLLYNERTVLLVLCTLEPLSDTDLFIREVSIDDRLACYNAIAALCSREFVPCDRPKMHVIEHPQSHFVISNLLRGDRVFGGMFSNVLMRTCGERLVSWVSCSRGCFILLHMLENGSDETRAGLRRILPVNLVKRYNTAGATSLARKLQ